MTELSPEQRLDASIRKDAHLAEMQDAVDSEQDLAVWEWLDAENQYNMQHAAVEIGKRVIESVNTPQETTKSVDIPKGFVKAEQKPKSSRIKLDQVRDKIHSLALPEDQEELMVDSLELKTDNGKTVRLLDLRPFMTSQVQKGGPIGPDQTRLEGKFFEELKNFTDTGGGMRNTVEVAHGVGYAVVRNSKIRAYYMPINDETAPNGVLTVARIADCSNSEAAQTALYRRVFNN